MLTTILTRIVIPVIYTMWECRHFTQLEEQTYDKKQKFVIVASLLTAAFASIQDDSAHMEPKEGDRTEKYYGVWSRQGKRIALAKQIGTPA